MGGKVLKVRKVKIEENVKQRGFVLEPLLKQ
jgi:hypothetical protein